MHPTASNCTTISPLSLSEEVGDFEVLNVCYGRLD